jgi:PAS domain S-box-containing protein
VHRPAVVEIDFRGLIEASPDAIAVLDRDCQFVYANASFGVLRELAAAAHGESPFDVQHAQNHPWRAAVEAVLQSGGSRELEWGLETPRGARRFSALLSSMPGLLVRVVSRDVTELYAGRGQVSGSASDETPRDETLADRKRDLQRLTHELSGAIDEDRAVMIMVAAGRAALGAAAGLAWLLSDADTLELSASSSDRRLSWLQRFRRIDMSAPLPACDVVRTGQPLFLENVALMSAQYPLAAPPKDSPYRAWVVMPILVSESAVGAVSFAFLEERESTAEDRELFAAMIAQASLAIERCRLLEAERRGRAREHELHLVAARLSSALTPEQIASIACDEAVAFLGAQSGAAAVRVGDEIHILGTGGEKDDQLLARIARVPIDIALPLAEAVQRSELVWCGSEAELAQRYSDLEGIWRPFEIRSWGAVPFSLDGNAVGSLGVSFTDERTLDEEERDFLRVVGQLAAQALERSRLYAALRDSEERLRSALAAARAGTWAVDLETMTSTPDASCSPMIGSSDARVFGEFIPVHPDDRAIARQHFERTLRDDAPYEPELRVLRNDGSYLWIRAHGRLIRDEVGRPIGMAGVVVDIDEAKRAGLRAEEARELEARRVEEPPVVEQGRRHRCDDGDSACAGCGATPFRPR